MLFRSRQFLGIQRFKCRRVIPTRQAKGFRRAMESLAAIERGGGKVLRHFPTIWREGPMAERSKH